MTRGFESSRNPHERPSSEEKTPRDWRQLRKDVRHALKGIGLGIGGISLGVAFGVGTVEKKSGEVHPPQESASLNKEEARYTEAGVEQQAIAPAPDSSMPYTAETAQQEPQDGEKVSEHGRPSAEPPAIKGYRYYQELVEVNPSYIFFALDDFKDLPPDEARQLLWAAKENVRDANMVFRALSEIRELDIFSEQEFEEFVANLIEKNPTAYSLALRAPEIASYIPQDAETILRASEQDPLAFATTQEGAEAEAKLEGQGGALLVPMPLPESVRKIIEEQGDASFKHLFEIIGDPASEEFTRYTRQEKEQIAVLLPLVREGHISFDDAAHLDPLNYFQKLSALITQDDASLLGKNKFRYLTFGIQTLLSHPEAGGETLEQIKERFSADEVRALISGVQEDGPYVLYERLIPVLRDKMEKEQISWEDSMKKMEDGGLHLAAVATEAGQVGAILEQINPRGQERMLQQWFDRVRHTTAESVPDAAIVVTAFKDSTLMGLVKNEIEDIYRDARTRELRGAAALLARVAQETSPEPPDSPFAKIAALGSTLHV